MWERFSYYGMRALLILYLTKFWLFDDGKSNLIYGAYTSLVYITPVLGGYLADRYLGQRKAVMFGGDPARARPLASWRSRGCTGVTDPLVKQADPAINVFWLALALIIVGSGFLKANISVIVGQLYRLTDIRRDARLHDLLHGHEHRRRARHDPGRLSRRDGRLVLWLRARRDRHGRSA